ncbi:aminotransferase class IV [Candidatus Planktophila versatilis]|uniref:aminotransferase class IV n=1 Tax=Candidatus Planktophila versatilis TaxID=1884905 RepID=UPI003CF18853
MTIELDSYGFPRTSGIFETIKTIDGKPIALARHMRRAINSALELGITFPDEESIRMQLSEVLGSQKFAAGRLRLCFADGLFHISHAEYEELQSPSNLNFYSETVTGLIHKKFPYDYRFAILKSARDEGFDDSILFNAKNEITEAAVSNLVFRIEGAWVTPPITSGVLPGIVRAVAIEECGVSVRPIHISEVPEFQSGFLVSSLRIAQPIAYIGDMKLEIGQSSRELEAQIRAHLQPVSVG